MAKVRNNTSQSQFWMWLQIVFYPHFYKKKKGYRIRKYERYIDDHSVPVLKSTKLDRNKRSATRSNTANSIPRSVVSIEPKEVVPTEESTSHRGKHLYKRQKQLNAITEVRWNSGPQMVTHSPKYKTILLIADRQRRTTSKL